MYIMVPMRASRLPLSSTCGLRSNYLTQTTEEPSTSQEMRHQMNFRSGIGPVLSIMVIVGWVLGDFFRRLRGSALLS